MNLIAGLKASIIEQTKAIFAVSDVVLQNFEFKINTEAQGAFGDLSCNVAMLIAKAVGQSPRAVAAAVQERLEALKNPSIQSMVIAGPGFLNITLSPTAWNQLLSELYTQKSSFFAQASDVKKRKYLIEFVSANPTGPLHLGHGRGGIIGDVLTRVLTFLGNTVHKEFYINDAGNQVKLLGQSLKVRCLQEFGETIDLPEGGYAGLYMVDLAKDCVAQHGEVVKEKSDQFFELYAKEQLLNRIKADLATYKITFDRWFSEKTLHDDGAIDRVLKILQDKELVYEQEGAQWFKSTAFGDDKDRVIKKSSGELTYVAADIAYHKDKFDRGYDVLIDILGHDHHGYVNRLKATMDALGYGAENLHVILYQLVTIKNAGVAVKMSKRAGMFTELSDVIEAVGVDVARFFYLNRRTESALDFDMEMALKTNDENPVYYLQYAYVRINSVMTKARAEGFEGWMSKIDAGTVQVSELEKMAQAFGPDEHMILKKIVALSDILRALSTSYHTHLLAVYALELAQCFHAFYTRNKIIDLSQPEVSHMRLCVIKLTHQTLDLCLDLLGLSKPERM